LILPSHKQAVPVKAGASAGSMEPFSMESFRIDFLAKPESFRMESFRRNLSENIFGKTGIFFFLEAFCNISHRLGGITPLGVFSDAFPGLKMWDTFACATAKFLTH
jgi:hypothetical protein